MKVERTLVRNQNNRPKRVIFIGNGMHQGIGWDPLKDWLIEEEIYDYDPFPELYLLERADSLREVLSLLCNLADDNVLRWDINTRAVIDSIAIPRANVSVVYKEANDLKKPTLDSVAKLLLSPETSVITSNWDNVLWEWEDKGIPNICQIHGGVSQPESLIFPSESIYESCSALHMLQSCPKDNLKRISRLIEFLRIRKSALLTAENIAKAWLRNPNLEEVIFWGVGLHTYDAEILSLISLCARTKQDCFDHAVMCRDAGVKHEFSNSLKKITLIHPGVEDPELQNACKDVYKRLSAIFHNVILEDKREISVISCEDAAHYPIA